MLQQQEKRAQSSSLLRSLLLLFLARLFSPWCAVIKLSEKSPGLPSSSSLLCGLSRLSSSSGIKLSVSKPAFSTSTFPACVRFSGSESVCFFSSWLSKSFSLLLILRGRRCGRKSSFFFGKPLSLKTKLFFVELLSFCRRPLPFVSLFM